MNEKYFLQNFQFFNNDSLKISTNNLLGTLSHI